MGYFNNLIIYILLTFILSVAATLLAKPIWLIISGFLKIIFKFPRGELPRISGEWSTKFTEPNEQGNKEDVTESVKINQIGRMVWGKGGIGDDKNRIFKYRGSILRDTLIGRYKCSKKPAGMGAFQLLILPDDEKMSGWCMWRDRDTNNIEASQYIWDKINK